MATVDWKKIETEYVTDPTASCAKLAKKYGLKPKTVGQRCTREKWADKRRTLSEERMERTIKANSDKAVKQGERLYIITDKLLDRIDALIECAGDIVSAPALKQITGALKDIRDIQDVRSDRDIREQEARIRNLERQAAEAEKGTDSTAGVLILPCLLPESAPPEGTDRIDG